MPIVGGLIAESLRVGSVLEGVTLTVTKISRADVVDIEMGQPRTWTFLEFEAADEGASRAYWRKRSHAKWVSRSGIDRSAKTVDAAKRKATAAL